jgi:fatty-acyl-CoA synthase
MKARQGVVNIVSTSLRVLGADGRDVPSDGQTSGEVVLRGNNVTPGYFRDPEATAAASVERPDGTWFRTGDAGVVHPDGYLELRDRLKDIVISGGENIASIEVENALAEHPAVSECAVVGRPDDRWGEVPVAVVTLRAGAAATEPELIEFVKQRIARFKAPKQVIFDELPKTVTGKVQKVLLRQRLAAGWDSDSHP